MAVWTGRMCNPRLWLLVIWMAVIFSASGDAQSMHRSSRILEPVLRLLMPFASDQSIATSVFIGRKCAHVTEYAILAILCYLAYASSDCIGKMSSACVPQKKPAPATGAWKAWLETEFAPPLSRAHAAKILAFVTIYAASDEIHQSFVPNRYGSWIDVVIDLCGGALGLLLIVVFQRLRRLSHCVAAT